MTFLEAKQALARKLDIDYSDIANNGLWTDTDLGALIQTGLEKAWDFKPWPFTQKTKTGTTISTDYYDHPVDLMQGSITLLKVAGKEYTKLSMAAYLAYFENNANGTDKIWAEEESFIFINTYAYTVGDTLDLYGKRFPLSLSSSGDYLPFSPISDSYEHSGNEAIITLAYSEALDSKKLNNPNQAEIERKKAYETLEILWKPFGDAIARQNQTGRPMFNVPTLFPGSSANNKTIIGNFNL